MVGHSNLGFADAMRRAGERGQLTFTGIRHEGAASFAASAYGKLTGRPAACFAIAGPGSTNLLTGLYDAKLDQSPVLAISGQVPSKVLGRGAFQDLDLTAIFRDVAAWTAEVHAGSDHAELAALAVKHALDARGVAHLVLPDEVQTQPSDAAAKTPQGRLAGRLTRPGLPEIARAAAMISASRRSVVIAGHGARQGGGALRRLAGRLEGPVLTAFAPSSANHTGIAPYKPILQLDDNPAAIGRFDPVGAGIVGDAALTLDALLEELGETRTEDQRPAVAARWAIWRAEKARRAD